MITEQGSEFDGCEIPVKVVFVISKTFFIEADTHEEAHKKAHMKFMDTPIENMVEDSILEHFEIETKTDGPDGFDYIHR
jgi:hypothetical protein